MEKDLETVKKAIAGDADAFTDLYSGIYKAMYRYAYFQLGRTADAEDAVADTVVDAWEGIGSLRAPEAFRVWIFRILSAKCKRRRAYYAGEPVSLSGRAPDGSVKDLDSGAFGKVDEALKTEGIASPEEALALLSGLEETDRTILLLHVLAGFRTREIGDMLSLAPGTVRSRESRALKKLRKELSG